MKPALTLFAFLVLNSFVFAQSVEVSELPIPVVDKFTLLYPDARDISWELVDGNYSAAFKNGKMYTSAVIDPNGEVLLTETEIKTIALPEAATAYLLEEVKCKKIAEAIIKEDVTGVITFEAEADKIGYTFDSTGQLITVDFEEANLIGELSDDGELTDIEEIDPNGR